MYPGGGGTDAEALCSIKVYATGTFDIRQTGFASWGYVSLAGLSWVAA
jgi:hypothetical protein